MAHRIVAPVRWRIIGSTVRGPAHEAVRLPNQDAIWWQSSDGNPGVSVLALSDGHGNRKCFRSDSGSKFAVQVAIDVFGKFGRQAGDDVPSFPPHAQGQFARAISETWNRRVDDDIRRRPFTKQEEELVEAAEEHGFAEVAADPLLAYGATLVVVLLAPAFALYAQIGDGDILVVGHDGSTRRVFTSNTALPLNVTNSLCQQDAWRNFRFELVPFEAAIPELIVATTDGYVNSFSTDDGFLQVGRDLHAMIESDGLGSIERRLTTILADASSAGSRDDVTVGIVKRFDDKQSAFDESRQRAHQESPREAPVDAPYRAGTPDHRAPARRHPDDLPREEFPPPRRSRKPSRPDATSAERFARRYGGSWMIRIAAVATIALAILAVVFFGPRLTHHFFNRLPSAPDVSRTIDRCDAILNAPEASAPASDTKQAGGDQEPGGDNKTDGPPLLRALNCYKKAAQSDPVNVRALRGERYVYERLHQWEDAVRTALAVIIVDASKAATANDAQNDVNDLTYAVKWSGASENDAFLPLAKRLYPHFAQETEPLRPIGVASPVHKPLAAAKTAPDQPAPAQPVQAEPAQVQPAAVPAP